MLLKVKSKNMSCKDKLHISHGTCQQQDDLHCMIASYIFISTVHVQVAYVHVCTVCVYSGHERVNNAREVQALRFIYTSLHPHNRQLWLNWTSILWSVRRNVNNWAAVRVSSQSGRYQGYDCHLAWLKTSPYFLGHTLHHVLYFMVKVIVSQILLGLMYLSCSWYLLVTKN